jgi:hypothetical protein
VMATWPIFGRGSFLIGQVADRSLNFV